VPRHRLGVVLIVPPPVDREVDALRRACGDGSVERVPPHLTLVAPVNVRADRLDDALAVIRRAAATSRPLTLTLGPAASFLPANPVLYLAVGGDEGAVEALRSQVLVDPLAREAAWPFVPHVTLVDEGRPERVAAAVGVLADARFEVTFARVHLLHETIDAGRRRVWRPLADAALAAPAVVGRGGLELELAVSERLPLDVAGWAERTWEGHGREQYGDDWRADEPLAVTARRDGAVVGVAEGRLRGGEGYLARLVTAPEARGQGVGSHLLAAFEAECRRRGGEEVTLRAIAGGPAERFYRERGFTLRTALPRWRHGRDFVQLVRRL
jgi:2'-5' RNA ligase/ribosomal protein S18 acetylase RimI-like enzyme